MCKFCGKKESVKDEFWNRQIMQENVDFGFLGDIFISSYLNPEEKSLVVALVNNDGDAKEYKKRLSFCPFCGEQL